MALPICHMDPYIFAGGVILVVISFGVVIVKRIYDHRTQQPNINIGSAEDLLEQIAPKPPV